MKDLRTIMTIKERKLFDEVMANPRVIKEIVKVLNKEKTRAAPPKKSPIEILMSKWLDEKGDAILKDLNPFERSKFVELFIAYAKEHEPDLDISRKSVGVYFKKLRPNVEVIRKYKDFTRLVYYRYPYYDMLRLQMEYGDKLKRKPTDRQISRMSQTHIGTKKTKTTQIPEVKADPKSIFGDLL